jgi:hypothetical protein
LLLKDIVSFGGIIAAEWKVDHDFSKGYLRTHGLCHNYKSGRFYLVPTQNVERCRIIETVY